MALATLADLKQWLALSSNLDDGLLQRLLDSAGGLIERHLGRPIEDAMYDERYDGTGGQTLALPLLPGQRVAEIVSLSVDGRIIAPVPADGARGYRVDGNLVTLSGDQFACGSRNVAIVYRAGFAAVPPELAQACIEVAGLRYRERERIGHVSKSLAGETVTFSQKDMSDNVRAVLASYKKVILL